MRNLSIATGVLSLFFLAFPVYAANPLSVVINEIAWMGTQVSYNDEWIELYNNSDSPINLEGWILKTADGTPKINLTGTIAAKSFYLLERTDDNTVLDIPADQVYTGALGNSGENLKLYDSSNNVIDGVDCSAGWFAGLGKPEYKTMERISSLVSGSDSSNWQTSQNPGGTPKARNSVFAETPPAQESQAEPAESAVDVAVDVKHQQPPQQPIIYPTGIVFNELLPSPEGSDEEEEWIEIFDQNSFEVDLSGWQIADTAGSTNTYTFPKGTIISPAGFLVLSRPTIKITLNNDADGLNLSQPNGNIIDSVNYKKAPRGQSYNRINSKWFWSTILTPGSANIIPSQISETKKVESPKEEIKEPTSEKGIERELATIGEQIPGEFFSPLLIGLSIAIFSGIIILILKGKIKEGRSL